MDYTLETIKKWGEERCVFPFYTFNDEMSPKDIHEHIALLAQKGFGGVFIHARSGLCVPYLSKAWFRLTDACVAACEAHGIQAWIYDEFGWPSGTAGALVLQDPGHCITWLEQKDGKIQIGGSNGYVDALNADAVDAFIHFTHEAYFARYGSRIHGFFTDEPQFGRDHVPYTAQMPALYEARTGRDLWQDAQSLFEEVGEYESIRSAYYAIVFQLFRENYAGKIASWCDAHGYMLTGHYLEENTPSLQVATCGDLLQIYTFMQMPGVDWLGRDRGRSGAVPRQVASVCKQFEKRYNISESYACAGYGAELAELKNIADWEFANGINRLCPIIPHSYRGRRKGDYPSGMVPAQPYFAVIEDYITYLDRLSGISGNASEQVDVLVLMPLDTSIKAKGSPEKEKIVDERYIALLEALERHAIPYHVSNNTLLTQYGKATKACGSAKLWIGACAYDTVLTFEQVYPDCVHDFILMNGTVLPADTKNLAERLCHKACYPKNNPNIYLSAYTVAGERLLVARNNTNMHQALAVDEGNIPTTEIILEKLERRPLSVQNGQITFAPLQTRILGFAPMHTSPKTSQYLTLPTTDWEIVEESHNHLVLDYCVPTIDGVEHPMMSVFDLNELLKKKMDCDLQMRFFIQVAEAPGEECNLLVEKTGAPSVSVNGEGVLPLAHSAVDGTYHCYPVLLRAGENEVLLSYRYTMPEGYRRLMTGKSFCESDENRIQDTFDVENIVLRGPFGVKASARKRTDWGYTMKNDPVVVRRAPVENISDFTSDGRPFFCGTIRFRKTFCWTPQEHSDEVLLSICPCGGAVKAFLNGKEVGAFLWNGQSFRIENLLLPGENTVELEFYSNLRNFFGPLHNPNVAQNFIGFTTFGRYPGWCDPQGVGQWTDFRQSECRDYGMWRDDYHIVRFGVRFYDPEKEQGAVLC